MKAMRIVGVFRYATRLLLVATIGVVLVGFLPAAVQANGGNPIDLELGGAGASSWDIANIAPGDSGTETVELHNAGSRNGFVTIWISDTVSGEGLNPESETGDTSEPGELDDHLLFNLSCSGLSTNLNLPVTIGNLPRSVSDPNYIKIIPLNAGDTVDLEWQWQLPPQTDNDVQGDSLSFTINYLLKEQMAITVTADRIQIPADGTSTTIITATVRDGEGGPVVDGTLVRFTTNQGSFSNGTQAIDKETLSSVARAKLESVSSTETVIATVIADVHGSKGATSALFITPGEPGVSGREVNLTSPGEDTVDAISTADTEVTKSGNVTPVVTVAKYTSNPGGAAPTGFAAAGDYIDVHLNRTENVDQISIKHYYTAAQVAGLDEASLKMNWWNGTSWVPCSVSGVNMGNIDGYSGYVWATVTTSTTPNLTDLRGAAFSCIGTPLPVGGGGGISPPPVRLLTVDTLGRTMQVKVELDGTLLKSFITADVSGNITLGLDSGTRIICTNDKVPQRLEVRPCEEPLPVPEGFATVSQAYDFIAYTDDGEPQPVTFDPAIKLLFNYDPEELPENTTSVFIAYYDEELGWTHLEPPTGFVAEVGTAAAQVSHFTSFAVMANLAAPILPALFELSNLDISPLEVKAGESITITAWLANIGGLRGEHTVIVNMKGLLETSQAIGLAPGQSQKLTFTVTPGSPGSYTVAIDELKGSFMVEAVPVPPTPEPGGYGWLIAIASAAALAILAFIILRRPSRLVPAAGGAAKLVPPPLHVKNLRITPKRVKLGKKVTIIAEASNPTSAVSNYSLVLRIEDRVEAVKEITLEPGQRQKIAFTILKDRPGTYNVEMEESKDSFTVEP